VLGLTLISLGRVVVAVQQTTPLLGALAIASRYPAMGLLLALAALLCGQRLVPCSPAAARCWP